MKKVRYIKIKKYLPAQNMKFNYGRKRKEIG